MNIFELLIFEQGNHELDPSNVTFVDKSFSFSPLVSGTKFLCHFLDQSCPFKLELTIMAWSDLRLFFLNI